eukprot:jgi/Bigna1/138529/aug1.45_g13237
MMRVLLASAMLGLTAGSIANPSHYRLARTASTSTSTFAAAAATPSALRLQGSNLAHKKGISTSLQPRREQLLQNGMVSKDKALRFKRGERTRVWASGDGGMSRELFDKGGNMSVGASGEGSDADIELLKALIASPFDGAINPIFVFVFNSLGIIPAVCNSDSDSGSSNQRPLPALPFVLSSFFAGFFALGPYLGLREERAAGSVTKQDLSGPARIAESKILGGLLLLASVGMLKFVFTSEGILSGSAVPGFWDMFSTQKLVHVSSLDFFVLSAMMYGPILEDLKRRTNGQDDLQLKLRAALATSLPLLGPSLHLITRPSLPDDESA